jgi:hypothetical protein
MRNRKRVWLVAVLAAFPITGAIQAATSSVAVEHSDQSPVISRRQIEADWLRQRDLREHMPVPANLRPEDDAAGGCDGVKTGTWGFHTGLQANPWWRVDLGQTTAIDRLVLFNRCDEGAERCARFMVLVSDDDKSWKQVCQHDGKVFFGYTDKKPLEVKLGGVKARYVRLQVPGTIYFHLDEVEIYAKGDGRNLALGRPATQSSVSLWSVAHRRAGAAPGVPLVGGAQSLTCYATAKAIERGLKLAADLRRRGVDVNAESQTLDRVGKELENLPARATVAAEQKLYFEARGAARQMALRDPLLDFDTILFVKHAPSRFPHMSDQFYGWWSRPGGGVFLLEGFKFGVKGTGTICAATNAPRRCPPSDRDQPDGRCPANGASAPSSGPKLRCLTADMPLGSFLRPDLSYDGKKVLFAYCKYDPKLADVKDKAEKSNVPEDAFYHVFEIGVDGQGRRQLTHGRYDDFDARYLPSGDIVFLSTRKGLPLQCSKANSQATTRADLPNSYVRCGGDAYRPVPVFTLHVIDRDGGNLRPISAFENFEWTPSVASDGRILYTRWDYIDRFNGHFFSLWSTNPDGTNPQLIYGNYTMRPQVKFEARSIPNSQKLIITAGAHHSNVGGSLVLLDRTRGTEEKAPVVRLTPEVPFPETEGWAPMYYANPYPLSEEQYLVSWSDRALPPHCRVDTEQSNPSNANGIYLYDAFGNLNLLYRDPAISSMCPIPVRPRPAPPAYPNTVAWDGKQEGRFMLQDVYQGLTGIPRGAVQRLRIVAVPPKTQPNMNSPNLGVSAEDPGKFVLGTVPVEADGSAYFRVPSGVPLLFQALDEQGAALQTMRSLTYVQPQQTLSCIGCHESREAAPPGTTVPLATLRKPSRLTPGPQGSWPLRFDELVQPVLDRYCVSCHKTRNGKPPDGQVDLTAPHAYGSLLTFGGKNLHNLVFERNRSIAGETPARQSKLLALLTAEKAHGDVRLDAYSLQRLITWMDLYGQRQGHYSPKQEEELRQFRRQLAPLLDEGSTSN